MRLNRRMRQAGMLASLLMGVAVLLSPCKASDQEQTVAAVRAGFFDSTLIRLGNEHFQKMKSVFDHAYRELDLAPTLTDSYFADSKLYSVAAMPIAQTPLSDYRLEVFGHMHDSTLSVYQNLSGDSIYHDLGQRQLSYMGNKDDLALGFGFVAPLNENVQLKSLLSTHHIPGYGDSKFVFGLEYSY